MNRRVRRAVTGAMAAALLAGLPAVTSAARAADGPSVSVSDPAGFAGAVYTVEFETSTAGALGPGATITLTAPMGTDFFYDSTLFRVEAAGGAGLPPAGLSIATTGPAATDNSYYANQAVLTIAQSIPASTDVTVTATGVTNPGPGRYQMAVATSAQPTQTSAPYSLSGSGQATYSTYTDSAGTRAYMLYQPTGWTRTRAMIVDLPGCTETSSVEARWSRFPELAAERGFTLLVPEEDYSDNGAECWNWFEPSNWDRGAGEPEIIADLTRSVIAAYQIDPDKVYVTGISAGGVMSEIMGVTYPDIWSGVGIYAGCEYQGLPCFGAPAAQPPEVAAEAALQEMGPRLKPMPLIVVNGTADELVPPANDDQAVQQWLYTDAVAAGRSAPLVPVPPTTVTPYDQPGRQPATIERWYAGGRLEAEHIVVAGMAHQWSGAADAGTPEDALITDPDGPDVTTPIVDFFLGPPLG